MMRNSDMLEIVDSAASPCVADANYEWKKHLQRAAWVISRAIVTLSETDVSADDRGMGFSAHDTGRMLLVRADILLGQAQHWVQYVCCGTVSISTSPAYTEDEMAAIIAKINRVAYHVQDICNRSHVLVDDDLVCELSDIRALLLDYAS